MGLSYRTSRLIPFIAAIVLTSANAGAKDIDPLTLYGPEHRFTVVRNDSPVGEHTVTFTRRGEDVEVRARFDIQIRFLVFTAYRYEYESTTVWRDGRLLSLSAYTNDDGEESRVRAVLEEDRIRIDGPRGTIFADPGIIPTDHWNAAVLPADRVLNTITGGVNRVKILDQGAEAVNTANGPVPARRYQYTGELENEVWYDADGRWVRMRFKGRDGSTIDYVCETCESGSGGG